VDAFTTRPVKSNQVGACRLTYHSPEHIVSANRKEQLMTDSTNKPSGKSPAATPAPYSKDLPATPQERNRELPDFEKDVADKEQGPDPRDVASPSPKKS
jgi:hypothetical protein